MGADGGRQDRGRPARRAPVFQPARLRDTGGLRSLPAYAPLYAGLDELRAALQQSGVPLWQLRQALLPLNNPPVRQAEVAAERFAMTPRDLDIVTTPNVGESFLSKVWNVASPGDDLAPVPAFLQAAILDYDLLRELLKIDWVQAELTSRLSRRWTTIATSRASR